MTHLKEVFFTSISPLLSTTFTLISLVFAVMLFLGKNIGLWHWELCKGSAQAAGATEILRVAETGFSVTAAFLVLWIFFWMSLVPFHSRV